MPAADVASYPSTSATAAATSPHAPSLRPATSSDPLVHPSPSRLRTRPRSVYSAHPTLREPLLERPRPTSRPSEAGPSRGQGWVKAYETRLSRAERDVLDKRWEDMTDDEIVEELMAYGAGLQGATKLPGRVTGHEQVDDERRPEASTSDDQQHLCHDEAVKTNAQTPLATPTRTEESAPLFPPSPPLGAQSGSAHPLRILSRVLGDMKEAIAMLEEENANLQRQLEEQQERVGSSRRSVEFARDVPSAREERQRPAEAQAIAAPAPTQVSIPDSISEALSTSLTSISQLKDPGGSSYPVTSTARAHTPSLRSVSPAPSVRSRLSTRSRASTAASASIPSASKDPATPVQSPSSPSSIHTTPQAQRKAGGASWTSGLWVWNRKSTLGLRQAAARSSGQSLAPPSNDSEFDRAATSATMKTSTPSPAPSPLPEMALGSRSPFPSTDPPPYSFDPSVPPPASNSLSQPAGARRPDPSALPAVSANPAHTSDHELNLEPDHVDPTTHPSTPSLRAIILATRILTPDPMSILTPATPPRSLIAYLAHGLVSNAREDAINLREPPSASVSKARSVRSMTASLGRGRADSDASGRSRAGSIVSTRSGLPGGEAGVAVTGYGDQALAVGRSLYNTVKAATGRTALREASPAVTADEPVDRDATIRPSLLGRLSSSRTLATTALSPSFSAQALSSAGGAKMVKSHSLSGAAGNEGSRSVNAANGIITPHSGASSGMMPTMELADIVPDEIKPPTMTLSRTSHSLAAVANGSDSPGALRTAAPFGAAGRKLATRFANGNKDGEVLMDRYGFIYDIQHYSLLKDASSVGLSGPSSLLGETPRDTSASRPNPVADDGMEMMADEPKQEGWVAKQQRLRSDSKSSGISRPSATVTRDSSEAVTPSDGANDAPAPSRKSISSPLASPPLAPSPGPPILPRTGRSGTPDSHRSRQSLRSARSDAKSTANSNLPGPAALLVPSPVQPAIATVQDDLAVTVSLRGGKSLQPGPSPSLATHASNQLPDASLSHADGSKSPARPDHRHPSAPTRETIASLVRKLNELHDAHEASRQREWDRWFARRAAEAASASDPVTSGANGGFELSADSELGQRTLLGLEEIGLKGTKGEEEKKELSRLIRGGVPGVYRAQVWAECSGAKGRWVPGDYADLVSVYTDHLAAERAKKEDLASRRGERSPGSPRFKSVDTKVLAEIEKDVVRTFPSNVYFGGDGVGVDKLRRVLVAYSLFDPLTGYCQGMNMLAATLLLVFPDEEHAFHTLVALLSSPHLLPLDYFSTSLLASRADQVVLSQYVKKLLPRVWGKMEREGVALESVSWGWFGGIFGGCLGVETLFRVWDVFFYEGHDVLFRVALAILKLAEPDILACESAADLFGVLSGMMGRTWSADRLVALQHGFKDKIRHDDVRKRCDKARRELRAQEALQDAM